MCECGVCVSVCVCECVLESVCAGECVCMYMCGWVHVSDVRYVFLYIHN